MRLGYARFSRISNDGGGDRSGAGHRGAGFSLPTAGQAESIALGVLAPHDRSLDSRFRGADNDFVTTDIDRIVRDHMKAARKVRRANNTPAKKRAFLLSAGILERHKGSPNGVRLAKRFR
jgi:hypothetical protein